MSEETEVHSLTITLKQVWDAQNLQGKEIAAMSAKLDLYVGLNAASKETTADHEARIRTLEQRVWSIPSIATLIALGSLLWAIFGK